MNPRRFAHFACIDWSGAAQDRLPGLAVACVESGEAAPLLLRPDGGWSRTAILDWLLRHAAAHSDLLVGIDFSAALPFADAGAYFPGWPESPGDARALWRLVDDLCARDPFLSASSFVSHPEASRHFRHHGRGTGDRFTAGLGRLRRTEAACRVAGFGNAQSSFNLVGAAQVGKSSLTGMRVLHRLHGRLPVWPFDPVPEKGPLIVEIYTTIAARAAGVRGGSKMRDGAALDRALAAFGSRPSAPLARYDDHATDALLGAAWLRWAARRPSLWNPPAIADSRDTEGWTFGVP